MELSLGQLVISKQGRDRGSRYVIIKTEEKCCYLADGRKCAVDKPKKKNYKHLQGTRVSSDSFIDSLTKGMIPSDLEVRNFLNHHAPENGQKEE